MSSKIYRKAAAWKDLRDAGIEHLGLGEARVVMHRDEWYWLYTPETQVYHLVRIFMGAADLRARVWTGSEQPAAALWCITLALDKDRAKGVILGYAQSYLGSRTSDAKAAASRANGRLGGRPRKKPQDE